MKGSNNFQTFTQESIGDMKNRLGYILMRSFEKFIIAFLPAIEDHRHLSFAYHVVSVPSAADVRVAQIDSLPSSPGRTTHEPLAQHNYFQIF